MSARAPIPYGRQSLDERDLEAVTKCLQGDWLTQGPTVEAFEKGLCEHTGAKYAVAVSNGTAALHLAYLAMGVTCGDVGVTAAVTFVATANGLRYAGADVGFADIDPRTGLVTGETLQTAVDALGATGRSAKVLAPVDLTGQPFDRAAVRAVADRAGAMVLEDAAHSLGGEYEVDGVRHRVGSCAHAEAAILSFHPVKHITTGEGGAILTNDATLRRRLLELRSHGIHREASRFSRSETDPWVGPWYYEQTDLGFNYRITDMQCALGLTQLDKLPRFVERRRALAVRYGEALAAAGLLDRLAPLEVAPDIGHAYHLYVVQLRGRPGESLESLAQRRKDLFVALRAEGLYCQVHYVPVPWQPYYRAHPPLVGADLPGAAAYYAASISLPMFPDLNDADVDRVVASLGLALGTA